MVKPAQGPQAKARRIARRNRLRAVDGDLEARPGDPAGKERDVAPDGVVEDDAPAAGGALAANAAVSDAGESNQDDDADRTTSKTRQRQVRRRRFRQRIAAQRQEKAAVAEKVADKTDTVVAKEVRRLHIQPPVAEATFKRRHLGLVTSFVLAVLLPAAFGIFYLYTIATDQYGSTVAFSVVKEEISSPLELFGGVADIGGTGSSDPDILYEYIQSPDIVAAVDERLDLRDIYSKPEDDPVFALSEDASFEDLHDYWQRMLQVIYDPGTGLITLRVLAFDPDDAYAIANVVLDESRALVDELSEIAQEDTTRFAREELERSVERLKEARQAITHFRSTTQIVDPSADLQGQMGLLNTLQQQLAATLIDTDLLRESTREGDIRLQQAERRIEVIEARIAEERKKLGVGGDGEGGNDYATLMSEYERLAVDREFAEQAYTAALAAFDSAQAEARRKSKYLFAHIKPTLPTTSRYPQREMLSALLALFLLTAWGIAVVIYYSIRDRR